MTTKLLFLAPAPPSDRHGGGALRMLHLLRFLSRHFEVDLVAPALDGVEEATRLLQGVCSEMEFVPVEGPAFDRLTRVGPYVKDRPWPPWWRNDWEAAATVQCSWRSRR
ncbi:MAG: hypothetical protein U0361_04075 [Nitrospiraceae bacterium]